MYAIIRTLVELVNSIIFSSDSCLSLMVHNEMESHTSQQHVDIHHD